MAFPWAHPCNKVSTLRFSFIYTYMPSWRNSPLHSFHPSYFTYDSSLISIPFLYTLLSTSIPFLSSIHFFSFVSNFHSPSPPFFFAIFTYIFHNLYSTFLRLHSRIWRSVPSLCLVHIFYQLRFWFSYFPTRWFTVRFVQVTEQFTHCELTLVLLLESMKQLLGQSRPHV